MAEITFNIDDERVQVVPPKYSNGLGQLVKQVFGYTNTEVYEPREDEADAGTLEMGEGKSALIGHPVFMPLQLDQTRYDILINGTKKEGGITVPKLLLPLVVIEASRTKVIGQTIVLENLINDLYDPTLRRFEVDTIYDELMPIYIYQSTESATANNQVTFLYTAQAYTNDTQQLLKKVYLNRHEELGMMYDFVVKAPDTFTSATDIVKLKATVDYYRLAGKRPHYQYLISLQSF